MPPGARWLKGYSIENMRQKVTVQSVLEPKPVSRINPLALQAMKEVGIDISNQKSKIITEDMIKNSGKSVNMNCIDRAECPMSFQYTKFLFPLLSGGSVS